MREHGKPCATLPSALVFSGCLVSGLAGPLAPSPMLQILQSSAGGSRTFASLGQ